MEFLYRFNHQNALIDADTPEEAWAKANLIPDGQGGQLYVPWSPKEDLKLERSPQDHPSQESSGCVSWETKTDAAVTAFSGRHHERHHGGEHASS